MHIIILLLLLACAIILELAYRVHLYHTRRERIIITLIFFVVGVVWDALGTARGIWIFPGAGLMGIWIGVLPLEEYLFSLIVPFWILTVYRVLDSRLRVR